MTSSAHKTRTAQPVVIRENRTNRDRAQSLDYIASAFAYQRAQLVALARRIVGERSEAEDIVQSAFTRACEAAPGQSESINWGAWLQTVVRNHAIDHKRRSSRLVLDMQTLLRTPTHEWSMQMPMRSEIDAALGQCKRTFRSAFELWYFENMSYSELATALGVPIRTAATRLHRAKAHIRETLGFADVTLTTKAIIRSRHPFRHPQQKQTRK